MRPLLLLHRWPTGVQGRQIGDARVLDWVASLPKEVGVGLKSSGRSIGGLSIGWSVIRISRDQGLSGRAPFPLGDGVFTRCGRQQHSVHSRAEMESFRFDQPADQGDEGIVTAVLRRCGVEPGGWQG